MRFGSRAAYAVQAVFDMGFHGAGRAVQAREIAERAAIPLRYLEQILQDLRRAGLVEARRGPRGGYSLGRAPQQIPLADVVAAVTSAPTDEPAGGAIDVPRLFLREISGRVHDLLAGVTVGDMIARAESLGVARAAPAEPQMYFI